MWGGNSTLGQANVTISTCVGCNEHCYISACS